jgi:uncharacterized membrane protein YgaE (UPF0421/DUF939 family)
LPPASALVQPIKAALAAGLAWTLGGLVPGAPGQPYLAPLTAMLTIQLTVAESVSGAAQRTLGTLIGVVVALATGEFVGVTPVTIAALVLLAQAAGHLLRLSPVGTAQVMVTSMLVLTIGGTTSLAYGWSRVAETIVGALVGVGINALLVPPTHVPAVGAAYQTLVDALLEELDGLASGLAIGLDSTAAERCLEAARDLARRFDDTDQALQRAEQGLRFNVLAFRERAELDARREAVQTLDHTAIQARSVARALFDSVAEGCPAWLEPTAFGEPLADLVRVSAEALQAFALGQPDLDQRKQAFGACRAAILARARAERTLLTRGAVPDGWVRLGSVLGTLDRLVWDLGGSSQTRD